MPATADALRPFWIARINEITGRTRVGVRDWIATGDYQLYDPWIAGKFVVTVATTDAVRSAFADDCNRLSVAAVESMESISRVDALPKSTAWALVKCYYAAFYSAHSLLRILGRSQTYFEANSLTRLNQLGPIFGVDGGLRMGGGAYECRFDSTTMKLACERVASDDGSHVGLWRIFDLALSEFSTEIMSRDPPGSATYDVGVALSELRAHLRFGNSTKGQWLSKVRNDVSYRQGMGVWFPYAKNDPEEILRHLLDWVHKDYTADIRRPRPTEIERFLRSCLYIVALNRDVTADVAVRCPKGRSFLLDGALKLLKLTEAA